MNNQASLLVFLFFLISCQSKKTYFTPTGINDRTEEYIYSKKGWIALEVNERIDGYTRIEGLK